MTTDVSEMRPSAAAAPLPIRGWVLLAVPLLGALVFAIVAIIAVVVGVLSGNLDVADGSAIAAEIRSNYGLMMGTTGLIYLSILFAAWLLLPKSGPASLASYFPPVSMRDLLTGVAAGVALVIVVLPVLGIATGVFHIDLKETEAERMLLPKNLLQLGALLLMGAVAAPLVEEVYFRGLFLRWLRKRLGIVVAAIINVVIFAAIHGKFLDHPGLGGFVATASLCLPAIVLVWLAVRTGSLWPGVITHGVYNGILLALSYFVPDIG